MSLASGRVLVWGSCGDGLVLAICGNLPDNRNGEGGQFHSLKGYNPYLKSSCNKRELYAGKILSAAIISNGDMI